MKRIAVVTLLVVLVCCFPLQAGAADTAKTPTEPQAVSLAERLNNPPTNEETKRIDAILSELNSGDESDTPIHLIGQRIKFISPRETYLKALKKNLSIQVSEQDSAIAKAAIQEAEAVFDPVLNLKLSYSRSDTYERTKDIYLQTKDFNPPPTTPIPVDPANPEPQINLIGWKVQAAGVRSIETVYASEDQENGPTHSFNYDLGITQKLPWGPQLNLGLNLHEERVYYDSRGNSYDKPWASTFVAGLTSPLPFARGFGPDSADDIAIKQRIKYDEASQFNTQAAINRILYQADMAYWDVVRRFENLSVIIQRRKLIKYQMESVSKRFENREATNYDRLQVESALAQSKVLETSAANALLDASYTLASLLEDEPQNQIDLLYLPYRYLTLLKRVESPDLEGALARALTERPELKASEVGIEIARINRSYSANQLRPDINFSGSYSASQDGSVYGYGTALKSVSQMGSPDKESLYASLNYQYPILNRALDARFEQAKLGVRQAGLSQRITKNSVIKEVGDATTQVNTSKSRIEAARESERFAALAFDKIQARQEYGDVREFEVLLTMQRMSEAQLSLVLALIDHRTALTGLSAAIGDLAATSADKALDQDLDRHRLAVMRRKNILPNFSRTTHEQEAKR